MIVFKKLTFRNILSVGNTPVSLDLSDAKTTLVHGTNGSGKILFSTPVLLLVQQAVPAYQPASTCQQSEQERTAD